MQVPGGSVCQGLPPGDGSAPERFSLGSLTDGLYTVVRRSIGRGADIGGLRGREVRRWYRNAVL